MSLLRQRAIETSAPSTLSAGSPALARDWLVSATSCDSSAPLKEFALHPKAGAGAARRPTDVSAKAATTMTLQRAVARRGAWKGIVSVGSSGVGSGVVPTVGGSSGPVSPRDGPCSSTRMYH